MTHFSFRGRRESPRGVSEHAGRMKAHDPTYGGACCPVKSGGWKLRSRGMWPTAREAEARVGAQSLRQWYTWSALRCDRATITKPAAGHGGHMLQSEACYSVMTDNYLEFDIQNTHDMLHLTLSIATLYNLFS